MTAVNFFKNFVFLSKQELSPQFKVTIVRRFIPTLILLAGCSVFNLCLAGEEVIELKDATAFGSGASTSDDLYYSGGVPEIGLFVGNPNKTQRNDRAIFSFDTTSLLLKTDKLKKAELLFWIELYSSTESKLDLEVERLREPPDRLTGQQLNDPGSDSLGHIEITGDDASNTSTGRVDAMEKRIDVTEVLKADLEEGRTPCVFRFRIPLIESRAVEHTSDGIVISASGSSSEKAKWPVLVVTLEE